MRRCSVYNCARPDYTRGLCQLHYHKSRQPKSVKTFVGGTRDCKHCGASFTGRRADALYCTERCAGKEASIKHTYGTTGAEVRERLKEQNHECGICREPISFATRHIDHDHADGRIRGLLCRPCNVGIGHLKDTQGVVQAAATYLQAAV